MDFFVCGNYASITCGTWIGLWSGAIGAFVAAVIGGFVALMVVKVTSALQDRHAADAREIAAIADVISAAESMAIDWTDVDYDTTVHYLRLRSAIIRLRLGGKDNEALWEQLKDWPESLAARIDEARSEREAEPTSALVSAIATASHVKNLTGVLMRWNRADKKLRETLIKQLVIHTNSLKKNLPKVNLFG